MADEKQVRRIESIAQGDLAKRNRTVKLVRKWQRRIWKETIR